jgi:hypothetical protein
MCGKNQFCEEIDPEYCAECYSRYTEEKNRLYNPNKKRMPYKVNAL